MNTLKPLAAALLFLASSASAQPTLFPTGSGNTTGGGFSLTSGNGGYFNPVSYANATGSGPIPDASFACTSQDNLHIPYASCTEAQLADRKRFNGECPAKSTACKEYLQRQLSGSNPAGTIAAYTPPPGSEWASPTCQHIPCHTKASAEAARRAAESPKPGDPDFMGPVLPPDFSPSGPLGLPSVLNSPNFNSLNVTSSPNPPAPTTADFSRAFDDAKASYGDRAIDLGNKQYGILDESGDGMDVCGLGGCQRGSQADHKDKIQQARAERFAFNNNDDTPAGSGPGNTKAGGQVAGGTPPPADDDSGSTGGGGGGSLGRGFADDQASISGAGGGDSSTGRSGGGDSAFGGGKGYIAVKPSEVAPVGSIQITHTALLKTESDINGAQRAFTSGQNGFAAPNDDTGSGAGDPPISAEHLGKIQAVANDGSAPK